MAKYFLFFLFLFSCTSILDVKEKEIALVDVPNQNARLKIVFMPSNATIQSAIQVRTINNDSEVTLETYQRYNHVKDYYFQSDTIFCIVLQDTISYLGNKPDTMKINIK